MINRRGVLGDEKSYHQLHHSPVDLGRGKNEVTNREKAGKGSSSAMSSVKKPTFVNLFLSQEKKQKRGWRQILNLEV